MKTSLHRIVTSDALELVGLLYEPDEKTARILVHVHGMAGNFYENKFIDAVAKTLTSNGTALFVFNNRGCELVKDLTKLVETERTIVKIGNAYEKFEDSLIDIKSAIDFVSSIGFSTMHLSGHSLGAPKVAYYSANSGDEKMASVIFLSPSDMVGLIKADKNYDRDIKMARQMVAEERGHELLPNTVLWDENFLSAQTYISLGGEESAVAIFNFHNPNDTLPLLAKITIPACAIMGKKDDALVVSIDETMARIKLALPKSPKVETVILADADHGFNGYEQALADALVNWIR
jgi:dienelactone hydrolase